jgi:hypothetical protein
MVNGREPNKDQSKVKGFAWFASRPEEGFIWKWCKEKNIDVNASYPIALKIAKEGITVPNRFYDGKFISDVVNDKRIDDLINSFNALYLSSVRTELIKVIKNGNN